MNDKITIEEIIAYMMQYVENKYEHDSEPMLNLKDIKCILDYITNLQEENKRLKKTCLDLTSKCGSLKLVKEAAIKYIHNHQLVFELSSKKQIQYWFDVFYKDLLNILNGDDKE